VGPFGSVAARAVFLVANCGRLPIRHGQVNGTYVVIANNSLEQILTNAVQVIAKVRAESGH
jgi:hypothetical protein